MPVKVKSVACGLDHTLVVDTEGNLYTGGSNQYGQLGTTKRITRDGAPYVFIKLFEDMNIVKVAAGNNFSMVLTLSGDVYTCGINSNGRLGLEGIEGKHQITEFEQMTWFSSKLIKISNIAAGGKHAIAVSENEPVEVPGTDEFTHRQRVYVWGSNFYYELGQGMRKKEDSEVPVLVDTRVIARKGVNDVSAGYNSTGLC